MNDKIIKSLEPTEYLKGKLNLYIDAFISYYGEKYREHIENRLNNIFIVAYQSDMDLETKLFNLEKSEKGFFGERRVKKRYKDYYDRIEYNNNLKIELLRKYRKEYAKRVKSLLPKKYHEITQKYIESEENGSFIFGLSHGCPEFSDILGDIIMTTPYEYFSEEMDEKLNNPEVPDFEKQTIIKNRITFFNRLDIDKGDDYSSYCTLEEYPSKETINKILTIKKEVQDLFNLELNSKTYPNCLYMQQQKEMGQAFDNSEVFSLIRLKTEYNCVQPNIRNKNGVMELSPNMFIYTGTNCGRRDGIIIHELNHIVEMGIESVLGNIATLRSGWDSEDYIVGEKAEHIVLEPETRKYERFNEVINELLAIDIHEKFKSIYGDIFSIQNDDYELSCSYLDQEYIVRDFFETYKQEIIESRITGNMQVLFDAIGEENFEALNNLVNEDHQSAKKGTAQITHDDIVTKRDTILNKMSLHSMMQTPTNEASQQNQSSFNQSVISRN